MTKDFYTFDAGCVVENELYFSSNFLNGLYSRNLVTGDVRFIGEFPDETHERCHLHKQCLRWNNKLIFLPSLSRHIHIWDIKEERFTQIKLSDRTTAEMYAGGCIYCDKLFLFPILLEECLVIYDLQTKSLQEVSYFTEWCKNNIHPQNDKYTFTRICQIDNEVYMPVNKSDEIVIFNLAAQSLTYKTVEVKDLFFIVAGDNGMKWAVTNSEKYIYLLDDFLNVKEKIYCDISKQKPIQSINNLIVLDREVYVLPRKSGRILRLNRAKRKFECLKNDDLLRYYNESGIKFLGFGIYQEKILIYPRNSDGILCIENGEVTCLKNNFDLEKYKKKYQEHYQRYISSIFKKEEIMKESELVTLQDFISDIV